MTQEECLKLAGDDVEGLLFAEGYDDAIVGVTKLVTGVTVVLYDSNRIIDSLMKGGMSEEEAVEYFEFNVLGAYMGEQTPLYTASPFFDEQLASARPKVNA